ncbi:beta strand repeat-containing protein [Undibacterium sp. SXout11W]|uniref:beta strand repeat-containing protein n=1 Tax=Undibacterium sp. SXout11W TaxID=3413050 RepID=UPI003BF39085
MKSGDFQISTGDVQNWGGNIRSNSITNSGSGTINISLGSGNLTDSGSLTFGSYNSQNAIFNIVQNGNGGVQIQSSGAGNITAPTITNRGTGNVSIAAGANLSPDSTGTGGQVLTLTGNTVTHASTGKTYIYTGSLSGTGDVSYLDPTNFSTLFYEGAANSLNAAFGQTVGNMISNGANSQVLFRQMQQTSAFNASLMPVNLTKVYDTSVLSDTEFKDALLAANTGNITQRLGNNMLGLAKADVIDHLYLDATSAMYKNVFRDSSTQSVNAYTLGVTNNNADTIINFSGNNTLTVTPATLTINGLTASNKVYDATTAASLNGTASVSALGTDQVVLSGAATGSFANKNVGNTKSVTIGGLNLTGADAGNYTLAQAPTNANITAATLTINGLTASNKVYDATTAASLNGTASVSALGTDQVVLSGAAAGSFADKNVGNTKSVTISGLSLTGTDAGNYTLAQAPTNANITAATLTINGLTASNKVYDATTAASLNGTASVSALGTDQVVLSGAAAGSFADKNVGNTKSVTISGLSLTGTDAGNYALLNGVATANIAPAILTLHASTNTKNYDGMKTAAALPTVSGLKGGDSINGVSESYANINPGLNKVININDGYTINDGNNGNNYIVQVKNINTGIIFSPMTNTSFIATSVLQSLTGGDFNITLLNNTDEPDRNECAFYVMSGKIILSQRTSGAHSPFAARALSCRSNQGSQRELVNTHYTLR